MKQINLLAGPSKEIMEMRADKFKDQVILLFDEMTQDQ